MATNREARYHAGINIPCSGLRQLAGGLEETDYLLPNLQSLPLGRRQGKDGMQLEKARSLVVVRLAL